MTVNREGDNLEGSPLCDTIMGFVFQVDRRSSIVIRTKAVVVMLRVLEAFVIQSREWKGAVIVFFSFGLLNRGPSLP